MVSLFRKGRRLALCAMVIQITERMATIVAGKSKGNKSVNLNNTSGTMSGSHYKIRLLDLLPRLIKRDNGYDRCMFCSAWNQMDCELDHSDDCPVQDVKQLTSDPRLTRPTARIELMTKEQFMLMKLREKRPYGRY